jgi:C-methyltransferase C-terminal domain/Putative zinc binding domain/Methyltransferase domain
MFKQIQSCRICGNRNLAPVLSLGDQYLTGVFPQRPNSDMSRGPLELVRCDGVDVCGLVQLRHSYDHAEMYGASYGYRSSLNKSMVHHLAETVKTLLAIVGLGDTDLILDIGSNDGTLLSNYPTEGSTLVGIDPTAAKFRRYYRPDICVIPEFFSAGTIRKHFGDRRARLVTSIAMFYDLEAPQAFAQQIVNMLTDDGVWHFEQSYLPAILRANSYDTICHEHLEYYALRQIQWIVDRVGLKIIDVRLSDINGGSIAVTAARKAAAYPKSKQADSLMAAEEQMGMFSPTTYAQFALRVSKHRHALSQMIRGLRASGKTVLGYGASTKGNVILQYCGLSPAEIPCIADVNSDKIGCVTPGTWIPIVSEEDARAADPDYFLVLPWHFRENLIAREQEFLQRGGKMIFPLPTIEVVSADVRT